MAVNLIPCIDGATLKCMLDFRTSKGAPFKAMFDMFIPNGADIATIRAELINRLILDRFKLSDPATQEDITKYSKAIFFNLQNMNKGQNTQKSRTSEVIKYERPEISVSHQVVSYLEQRKISETAFTISGEIVMAMGARPEVSMYKNLLVLILSRMDLPSIESVTHIDTDLIIRTRVTVDPKNRTERELDFNSIVNKMYDELIQAIKDADELIEAILKHDKMLSILNQLFERHQGFTLIKNAKRINDSDFSELMNMINEFFLGRKR